MSLKGIKITGDNKWRNILFGYNLSKKWRKEFDWIHSDEDYMNTMFVKMPGKNAWYYALNEFAPVSKDLKEIGWDGYHGESYFSGTLIKLNKDGDKYKIGLYTQ